MEMNEIDVRLEAERLARLPLKSERDGGIKTNGVEVRDTDKREKKGGKAVRANTIGAVFSLMGFKLPNKKSVFKNDDGTETEKLAYVLCKLTACGLHFRASIYSAIKSDAAGRYEEIYCSLPSSGKGFPRPVFEAEDPATQADLDEWREQTTEAYLTWAANLVKVDGPQVGGKSSGRIVRRLPATA